MTARRWRLGLLLREANLNVFRAGGAMWALAVVAVLMGTGVAVGARAQEVGFQDQLENLHEQGRGVITIHAALQDSPAMIDRATCEALAQRPDVERAGLVVFADRADLLPLGSSVGVLEVSPALAPALAEHDGVIGASLGLGPGPHRLLWPGGVMDAVVDDSAIPTTGMSSAVTVALPPSVTSADECLVELSNYARASVVSPELTAAVRSVGGPLTAQPGIQEAVDVLAAHETRPERLLPVLVGALGGIFAAIVNALRSSAFAAYRLSGTRRVDLLTMVWMEQALLAGLYACSGTTAAVILLGPTVPARACVLWLGVGAFAWLAGASLSWASAGRNPTHLAKDR